MKPLKISENRILSEIQNWLTNSDADDLCKLAGNLFGGTCVVSKGATDYEFTPNVDYYGAFGGVSGHPTLNLESPEHAEAYLYAARTFLSKIPEWSAEDLYACLTSCDAIPEAIAAWLPVEHYAPEQLESFISALAEDIVETTGAKDTNPANR